MYLKSLTLKGFKSFAQPTTFAFEPGVTCVVGPNGSGKSNVVDALAWVMGEQGVKTLRGGKMDDVIFAGTSTRGPLGRAAVTLTIDNSDGALPIDYSEVTISRTLFRTGASEYAINGRNCRLLDVQELLSDSGLGREMHVIVGQGQLDAVLRASPEERRGFIEEAAGILKHRRRKEKTLRKLDAMQANLTRLSDLAGEIRRQLTPLGRQAEVAREAQTIAATVRDARARLLADDVVTLRAVLDAHGRTERERHSERLVLQEQLAHRQARVLRLEEEQVGDVVDQARRTSFALEAVQERLRGLLSLATERLALLGSAEQPTPVSPGVTAAMVQQAEDEVERLLSAIVLADTDHESRRAQTVAVRARVDVANEQIAVQAALVSRYDLNKSELTGRSATSATRLAAVRGEVVRQQSALDAAFVRRASAQQLVDSVEAAGARLDNEQRASADEATPAPSAAALDRGRAEIRRTEGEIERLREALHGHERERDAQAARGGALALALDQRDGSSALIGAGLAGIRGLVAEHVRVQPGYETAIAAALGSLANAVLADTHEHAVAALEQATASDSGRVELIVADSSVVEPVTDADFGLVWARSVIEAPAGVLGVLGGCVIAETLATARAAYAVASGFHGLTVVTRAGEVLTDHALRGGSGATPSKVELIAERDTAAERLGVATTLVDRVRGELAELRAGLQTQKGQVERARTALRALEAARTAHADKRSRARLQLDAADADYERLAAAHEPAVRAVADAEATAVAAEQALQAALAVPRPVLDVAARDAVVLELEACREHEVEARLRVDTAHERVSAARAQTVSLTARLEDERTAALEAARRAVIRRQQADAASSVAQALPLVLASVDAAVSAARLRVSTAEADRSAQNDELRSLRREESALRDRVQAVTETVHGLELQIYEKKLHLSGLLERALSELGLTETVLTAEYGPEVLIPEVMIPEALATAVPDTAVPATAVPATAVPATAVPDASPLAQTRSASGTRYVREEQLARLGLAERKLGRLGRVNPLALEEFAALEQRHRFLTEQLTDLTQTRADLLTIIDEIDDKMQVIFRAAFDDTQAAFAEVFPVLFPGGVGSIWLTDPSDLLATGIEVSVKPAGKKIERLSLLSGGERSLAAVALLIAIFKARPSPFYIMDEVEAALDDANLGRLLTIFEDLRETSQLIVITHQKRTMEIADALYGVSMRQDGVSAVVGQRVERESVRESVAS
ncbi:chromosome segregation protein SMC [Cryobacterium frigoriphilum]|uniref:Chromosome partition protein Smc n=1 Tax=Cryobacterium frigoriphilum TaxID=1259150 RepID=A0A4R9AAI1_9MICO|nr:chromosome segregation protein SMC [Cryobacterium frigoriphilum]TFD55262.1 chromosome segregation protein SMC [Cryobacterium frigoriphilum]